MDKDRKVNCNGHQCPTEHWFTRSIINAIKVLQIQFSL